MAAEVITYIGRNQTYEDNYDNGPFGELGQGLKFKTEGQPLHNFLGHPVHLDLGIGAGTLLNFRYVKAALDLGWDVAEYKTVRSREYPCNPFPNLIPTRVEGDLTLEQAQNGILAAKYFNPERPNGTNSYGVPCKAPDIWVPDASYAIEYAKNYPGGGKLVIVSIQGTTSGSGDRLDFFYDIEKTARMVRETGAKVVNQNGSCPNEGKDHLLCYDIEGSIEANLAARRGLGSDIELLYKIGYFSDQELLDEFVKQIGPLVNGFVAINTIAGRVKDTQGNPVFPGKGREVSGNSGDSIRWASLDMLRRLALLRDKYKMDFKIISSGGITKPEHYPLFKSEGADGVLSVLGSLTNPRLALQTKEYLGIPTSQVG